MRSGEKHSETSLKTRREEEILEAAAVYFAQSGYTEADTQGLADRLGVGKGTIYRYFPSKRELFLAALDRLVKELHESITAAIKEIEDPIDRMFHAINAYLIFFKDRPEIVELMIQERAYFKDREKPTYFENRENFSCEWQEEYRRLIASGRIRDMPFEKFHDVFGDLLYGTMFTNYFIGSKRSTVEQAKDIFEVVLHGILSDSERAGRRL
ncbi:MAG: TetR/AcrR family transcriptional regulator [Thermoguttaceae bacterium]